MHSTSPIDWQAAQFWFNAVMVLFTCAIGFYTWLVNRQRATQQDIDRVDRRLVSIEERVRSGPSHEDIGKVYDRLNDVTQGMSELQGAVKGMSMTVDIINQHLIEQGKK